MAITRIKNSTISNRTPKYNDVLAGLPFRPIIGTATDGGNGTSASVAFTGNNVANGTITYTALSSPGSFTGTGTASPITVSGLTAGTAYTFQVKAGNSLGDSAYSAASNSVTPVTPSSYESIASVTASGGETSITFNSISSAYASLQLRGIARLSGGTGTSRDMTVRFNGDTANNYTSHNLYGNGTTVTANSNVGDTNCLSLRVTGSGAAASIFGVFVVDIHDYVSTTRYKTIRNFTGEDQNGSGFAWLGSAVWMNTAAINSITITPAFALAANSTFALYGIKS